MNALTQQDARTSNVVVEGTINIMEYTARILFDPSATHSFVFSAFISKLNMKPELLKFQLIVSTPICAKLIASMYYKKREVMLREAKNMGRLSKTMKNGI